MQLRLGLTTPAQPQHSIHQINSLRAERSRSCAARARVSILALSVARDRLRCRRQVRAAAQACNFSRLHARGATSVHRHGFRMLICMMRPRGRLRPLTLTRAEQEQLERWMRDCRGRRALAVRARIVLACQGLARIERLRNGCGSPRRLSANGEHVTSRTACRVWRIGRAPGRRARSAMPWWRPCSRRRCTISRRMQCAGAAVASARLSESRSAPCCASGAPSACSAAEGRRALTRDALPIQLKLACFNEHVAHSNFPTSLRAADSAIFQLICNCFEICPRVGHARHVDSCHDGAYNTHATSCCIWGSTMRRNYTAIHVTCAALLFALSALGATAALAQATDPGVRQATTDNGPPPPLTGLTTDERTFFDDGLQRFSSVKLVRSPTGDNSGLGPRFNSNQCSSCHLQPFVGGSSPAINPLPAVASAGGATNTVPWFIVPNGPIREARFVSDGGVHDLFVVTGRSDAPGCNIAQPVFTPAGNGLSGRGGNPNVVFRIPTSLLGAGLIEAIPDSTILDNARDNAFIKRL